MSTNPNPQNPAVVAPVAPGNAATQTPRKVVVAPSVEHDRLNLLWAGLAFIISLAGHALLVLVMMNANITWGNAAEPVVEDKDQKTVVDDNTEQEKELDLTNTDLGNDSLQQTNYNLDRIEDVSVPGEVNKSEAVGIQNAPEGPPRSLPPPPGAGMGTGGGLMDKEAGTAAMFGTYGGAGGKFNLGGFGGRSGATRDKMVKEGGGNDKSEACVANGLKWLALHQANDGHWSLHEFNRHARENPIGKPGKVFTCNCGDATNRRDDVAGTAFGLLPYLGAGMTHKTVSTGNAQDYSKVVLAGTRFLMIKQGKDGFYGGGAYSHGLATIAMCEAYGLTSDPLLKISCQNALNYIVNAQDPNGGGWRYSPKQAGDTSVTGWMLMALKSGQMSGLKVPIQTLKLAEKFLDACESSQKGQYGYTPGGGGSPAMTAAALLCRMYQGVTPRNESLKKGMEFLKRYPPGATKNLYYEYYATQVFHHMGGDYWDFWNLGTDKSGKKGIRDSLINQMDIGNAPRQHQLGSWKPEGGGHANDGGRIMATSLTLLCLEVYYRHLPLYRRDVGTVKP